MLGPMEAKTFPGSRNTYPRSKGQIKVLDKKRIPFGRRPSQYPKRRKKNEYPSPRNLYPQLPGNV